MYKDILRYIRNLLLMTIPFCAFVFVYIALDPFEVVWHYEDYFASRKAHISLNHFNVSASNFDSRFAQEQWNSYIVGNSRSRYYEVQDWQSHLPKGSKGYHFEHSGGSLYSLMKTFEYLDQQGARLDNVLMILDTRILGFYRPSVSHTSYTPQQMDGYKNFVNYHLVSFEAFCDYEFLCAYFRELFQSHSQPSINELANGEYFSYDASTNQIFQSDIEQKICDGTFYSPAYIDYMFGSYRQYPDSISPPVIGSEQIAQLQTINEILVKHHSNCRIIISPLYQQIRFSPKDLRTLHNIFCTCCIYDYSGDNVITRNYYNYYEISHYRPCVARKIMDEIYNNKPKFSSFVEYEK